MALQALLVDLDNTVYSYDPCHEDGLRQAWNTARQISERWASEACFLSSFWRARAVVKARIGRQAAAHSRMLYFKEMMEFDSGASRLRQAAELSEEYWKGFALRMQLDEGCLDALRELSSKAPIAWVSNYTTKRQVWKLERLGLADIGRFLITSEEAGAEKPDPRPLRLALEKLGAEPKAVLAVGDSFTEDVGAARACGIECAWMQRGEENIVASDAVFPVRNWMDVRQVVYDRLSR